MFSCSYPLWSPNNQRVSSLGPDLAQPVKGQSCHFLSRSWGIFFPAGRNHGWDQISEVCRSDLRFMECKGSKLMSWGRKLQESCPSTWTKLSAHKATTRLPSKNMDLNSSSTSPFTWFGTLRLPTHPIDEEGAQWSPCWQQWWRCRRCGPLSESPRRWILQRRNLYAKITRLSKLMSCFFLF